MRRVLQRAAAALRRFAGDGRGVSAIEFSLIAPVLILAYAGMAELSQGMKAARRVSHAASSMGDLVAQSDDAITAQEMSVIFSAAKVILSPFPTTGLKLRVSSVTGDAQGAPKVDWSKADGDTEYAVGSSVTLPAGLITAANENLVMAEASYTYTPNVPYVLTNGLTFNEKFYLRPRSMAKVPYTP